MSGKKVTGLVVFIVVLVGAGVFLFSCVQTVDVGCTGIVKIAGKISDKTLGEGWHLVSPITEVISISNQTQITTLTGQAASKDLQIVTSTIAVNHHVSPDSSASIYQKVGIGYVAKIIEPAINESVKAVTARYTAEELISKRQDISVSMKDELEKKVNAYGIIIENFNVTDFSFSEEFNKAIEQKQTAQQLALKAEQDLNRIKVEAQQSIEQAKAEAEALRIKKEQISPEMIQMEWITKWDGKLPTYMGGDSSTIMSIPVGGE